MKVLFQSVGRRIWTVGLLATALISGMMLSLYAGPIQAATKPSDGADLLKFTAGGHVLGFQPGSFIAAGSDHVLKVDFIGARPVSPQATNVSLKASKGVHPLDKVTYTDLWEGVTLVYDGGDGILESTYHIAPQNGKSNGSPSLSPVNRIRLRYNVPVALDDNGNLLLKFKTGLMRESAPVAWQEISGQRIPVKAAFCILDEKEVGFSMGDYDPTLPLVIDPVLTWNTFLGGWDDDLGNAIAVDAAGNVYVAGFSDGTWGSPVEPLSECNPGTCPYAFAAKLDSNGKYIWNTFMGAGYYDRGYDSSYDVGYAIAVDAAGNVYMAGYSSHGWDPPYSHRGDAFVVKLDSNGNRLWNTFMGSEEYDRGYGIALDATGNMYVAGYSDANWGSPVNPHAGDRDAFVAKLDSNGNRLWNTFMGSESADSGYGIAVDALGNIYVGGTSYASWGLPVNAHASGNDAFTARLDSDGNRLWNTFMGSGEPDDGYGIAVDAVGNVYLAGRSYGSWGSPVIAYARNYDAFMAKLDGNGNRLWNTFMGSEGYDRGNGIAADATGNVYVAGTSNDSWGLPVYDRPGDRSAFVVKLSATHLTLNKIGVGTGTVTSNPAGIDCGGNCSGSYLSREIVTLSATPDSGMAFGGWVASGCGATGDCTVLVDDNSVIYAIFNDPTIDTDLDSVSDQHEQGPSFDNPDYDGNADGTADWLQADVISCPSFDGSLYITTTFSVSGMINAVTVPVDIPAVEPPSRVSFAHGFYQFAINSMFAGFNARVTLYLKDGDPSNTYYKYGPTPSDPTDHWYEFLYDGETGAEINGNVITLHFVDGKRGDDDLDDSNGIITDPGGPAFFSSSDSGGGGGGGSCLIATAAYGFRMPKEILTLALLFFFVLIVFHKTRAKFKN
jgi:hypothetical protein